MSQDPGPIVVCSYMVPTDHRAEFERLLRTHVPTLQGLGLLGARPASTLVSLEPNGATYVEVFQWIDDEAASRAAEIPEVIAVWEPMAALCHPSDDRPAMEFPHYRELT